MANQPSKCPDVAPEASFVVVVDEDEIVVPECPADGPQEGGGGPSRHSRRGVRSPSPAAGSRAGSAAASPARGRSRRRVGQPSAPRNRSGRRPPCLRGRRRGGGFRG